MNARNGAVMLLCMGLCAAAWGEHSPLLPRPQQIQYGTGSVALRAMHIVFRAQANAADEFAAEQLRGWLEKRTGQAVSIGAYGNGAGAELPIVLERKGSEDLPLALPGVQPGPNSPEAYDLTVNEQGVTIQARSSAGIFYGAETLRQLVEGEGTGAVLPEVEIHDWPSMAYRGTMVDISHGPLPTEKEIDRQLDFLARWKANQYYLYTEDSLELTGYPLLNTNARLSKDEVRRIVAYGRERHIDVIPNFDLYGHEHDLFRIEQYSGLSDEPHGTEFDASNPKVKSLLTDWVNQFADLFPSPFASIGFDETFQIEAATHATGAAAMPASLFARQLSAVAGLFQQRGKTVMAYDDIMVKYPEVIPQLPKGLIAVAWYYTSEDPNYRRWLGPFEARHIPYIVQPGVTSWAQIFPDFDTSSKNIDTFLAAGRRSGALGLVNSMWADDAQLLFRMSLPGMAYGAAAPWQSTPMDKNAFFPDYARQMYPAAVAPDMARALTELTAAETDIQKLLSNSLAFAVWDDPFSPVWYGKLAAHRQDLHETRMHAEAAETALIDARNLGADGEAVNSLLIGSELLDYAGEKFQTALELSDIWKSFGPNKPSDDRWWNEWSSRVTYYDHSYVTDLMDRISDLEPDYRAEWLNEYTPYRMRAALGRWDAEYQYWRGVHQRLREFEESTHAGQPLPPLDKVIDGPAWSWFSSQH